MTLQHNDIAAQATGCRLNADEALRMHQQVSSDPNLQAQIDRIVGDNVSQPEIAVMIELSSSMLTENDPQTVKLGHKFHDMALDAAKKASNL